MKFKTAKFARIFPSALHRIEPQIYHRNISNDRAQGIVLRIREKAIDWSGSSAVCLKRRYCKRRGLAAVAALFSVAVGFSTTAAAQPQPRSQLARTYTFDIPAKPLAEALNDMSRISGVSVQLRDTKRVNARAVKGAMTVNRALTALLAGTGLTYTVTGANSIAIINPAGSDSSGVAGTQMLDTISVIAQQWIAFGDSSINDTGTTVVDADAFRIKAGGSSDANSFLRAMPNVQYQNQSSRDAGVDGFTEIDSRPLQVSIAGAKVYENNFRLNGVGINQITGSQESFDTTLRAETQTPNINAIFGLHPQTVFIPTEFIERATLVDGNASAKFGDFQGGVVDYKLADPPKKKITGSVSYGFQDSDLVKYKLGTEDGLNPDNKRKPRFERYKTATSLGVPITDTWSVLAQYSRQAGTSSKDKPYVLFNAPAEDSSANDFYRLSSLLETDYGKFTLEGSYTNYSQIWDGFYYRDLQLDAKTKGLTSQLKWETDLDWRLDALRIGNVNAMMRGFYNDSKTVNDGGSDQTIYRTIWSRPSTTNTNQSTWFFSTDPELLSWCRVPQTFSGTSATCREGGYGNKAQGQTEKGAQAELKGDLLLGKFLFGGEYRHIDAFRQADQYTLYATDKTLISTPLVSSFICPTGDPDCSYEQYANTKTTVSAFSRNVMIDSANAFLETEQKWRWFDVRAGVRVDYESYFGNVNLAPRLTGTYSPWDFLSFTGGYNRYYNANSVYYAVRDGQPIGYSVTRTHNAAGVVGNWSTPTTRRTYNFSGADLRTPYNDEYTAAAQWTEPFFDGKFRLRQLERHGRDQYLVSAASTSTNMGLTNDGTSDYRATSLEYTKSWNSHLLPHLNGLSLTGSATWSKRKTTSQGYVDDNWDARIWYNGRSYSYGEFSLVTGNLDIPVRTALTLGSRWFDDTLRVGASANFNLGYAGVRDTGTTCSTSATSACPLSPGSPGYGMTHEIFTDHQFSPLLTVDLTMQYVVLATQGVTYKFDLAIDNVFDQTGNVIATIDNPWLRGRAIWLGASATF